MIHFYLQKFSFHLLRPLDENYCTLSANYFAVNPLLSEFFLNFFLLLKYINTFVKKRKKKKKIYARASVYHEVHTEALSMATKHDEVKP